MPDAFLFVCFELSDTGKKGRDMAVLPYVTAALFCDRVLQEQDGTLSAIRIIDRVRLQNVLVTTGELQPAPPPPDEISAVHLTGLIGVKKGKSDGKFLLTIDAESPTKKITRIYEGPFELVGGEDRGQNVVIKLVVATQEMGLHWFDVRANGELLSRIPLVIEQLPAQTVSQKQPDENSRS